MLKEPVTVKNGSADEAMYDLFFNGMLAKPVGTC